VIPAQANIWLVLGSTDMRKSIDSLALVVVDQLNLDALSGQFFVFCNRSRNIIKILYWDRNGFCLWQKRLERFRFF
jgi:transposase